MFEFPVGNSPLKRISPCRDRTAEVSEMLHDKDQMHSLSPKHLEGGWEENLIQSLPTRRKARSICLDLVEIIEGSFVGVFVKKVT